MATRDRESIKRSTVGWVPGFLRGFFGLEDTFQRPSYAPTTSGQVAQSTTNWIPGPVRRWLGLEYTEPQRYERSAPARPSAPLARYIAAAPTPRPSAPPAKSSTPASSASYQSTSSASFGGRKADYRPPSVEGSGKMIFGSSQASAAKPPSKGEPRGSEKADYRPPSVEGSGKMIFGSSQASAAKPPSRGEPRGSGNGETKTPSPTSSQPIQTQGYVQPFTYMLRGYLRGAMPPQGLEAFTRQLRQTTTDVFDLYGRTIRFQTEEITKAFGNLFPSEKHAASTGAPTRIPIERVENKNKPAASTEPSASPSTPDASSKPNAPSASQPAPAKPAAKDDSSTKKKKSKA
ncbi:MAG: hypothetical protein MI924_07680 [Chloroflexales bacterium]|nr:hypothetical protein [Chloroflexales bacterium]